jgi:hypothetical protein
MLIRPLQPEDYDQAVDLKISCWDEELAGVAPNRLVKSEELDFILQWVTTAEEHQDIQGMPPDRLQIDVFVFDFLTLKETMAQAVQKRRSQGA